MWHSSFRKSILVLSLLISFQLFAQDFGISSRQLWNKLNDGWGGAHADLDLHLPEGKNYIVWSIIAPKKPLDLRTPDFFRSVLTLNSSKQSLSISHNIVAWKCNLEDGFYQGATGMSGETMQQSASLVKSGYGLTTFLATFNDGWLSGGYQSGHIIVERAGEEEVYTLVTEVSRSSCSNMLKFLKSFVYHPKRPFEKFSLALDPEKFEGGGCISFAAALMKKAGVLSQMFNSSERSLWASTYRFGGNGFELPPFTQVPKVSWREDKPKKVSLAEFFNANWNNAKTHGVNLKLIDPEILVWSFKSLSESLAKNPRSFYGLRRERCDSEDYCERPYYVINDKFDPQTKRASQKAKTWQNSMYDKGYRMRELELQDQTVLIFDK